MGFSILFKTELTTTGVFPLLEVMLSEIQGFNANPNLNFSLLGQIHLEY